MEITEVKITLRDEEKLKAFCKRNHIPGLMDLAGMEIELSAIIDRKVDLRTPQELSKYFRDEVLAQAEVQYAAA